jgi:hypothetical protein
MPADCTPSSALATRDCRMRMGSTPSQPDRHHLRCLVAKMILVTYKSDVHPGNVMWMLLVGGRAYAGQNGNLQESC